MEKVEYTTNRKNLKRLYLKMLSDYVRDYQNEWETLRNEMIANYQPLNICPPEIENVLTASFSLLNKIYTAYEESGLKDSQNSLVHEKLEALFHYEAKDGRQALQPQIALFFMNEKHGFKSKTCHYCGLAFVNAYGYKLVFKDPFDLVMHGDLDDYREFIMNSNGQQYADSTYMRVISKRHTFKNIRDFDNLAIWRHKQGTPFVSERIDNFNRNHFDLDHVLPKSVCPIVGLSLFNFVPSCQVCNEKLKGQRTLGSTEQIRKELSPTELNYSFQAKFILRNTTGGVDKLRYEDHPDDYVLEIKPEARANTREMINIFHLKTRYNFHKKEALRLMDLLHDYDDSHIQMIHNQLLAVDKNTPYTVEKMKSDIFRETSLKDREEVMARMKLDIIDNYRKKH